jgi:hypothetical protein
LCHQGFLWIKAHCEQVEADSDSTPFETTANSLELASVFRLGFFLYIPEFLEFFGRKWFQAARQVGGHVFAVSIEKEKVDLGGCRF